MIPSWPFTILEGRQKMGAEDSMWGMVLHYPDEHLIDILKSGRVGWLRTEVRFDEQSAPGQQPPSWGDAIRKVKAAGRMTAQQVYFGINPSYPKWIADGRPIIPSEPASVNLRRRLPHRDHF